MVYGLWFMVYDMASGSRDHHAIKQSENLMHVDSKHHHKHKKHGSHHVDEQHGRHSHHKHFGDPINSEHHHHVSSAHGEMAEGSHQKMDEDGHHHKHYHHHRHHSHHNKQVMWFIVICTCIDETAQPYAFELFYLFCFCLVEVTVLMPV